MVNAQAQTSIVTSMDCQKFHPLWQQTYGMPVDSRSYQYKWMAHQSEQSTKQQYKTKLNLMLTNKNNTIISTSSDSSNNYDPLVTTAFYNIWVVAFNAAVVRSRPRLHA